MKRPAVSLHVTAGSLVAAEIVTAAIVFATVATGLVSFWVGLGIGVLVGLGLCVVRFADAVAWQWARRGWRYLRWGAPRRLTVGGVAPGEDTVLLPDGSERTVASVSLAAAVRDVLDGSGFSAAFARAGLACPAVGTPPGPSATGNVEFGDIGQFTDGQVLALGGGKVIVADSDGQVLDTGGSLVTDMGEVDTSGPQFLGWFHPATPGVPIDVQDRDGVVGVLIDGTTLITMISVWGRAHMPTRLRPQGADTPNLVPIQVISEQMQRYGLGVDVDVISHGCRTSGDSYAPQYDKSIGTRSAAGQRSNTLVIRMDIGDPDTIAGLVWRSTTAAAMVAATRRIAVAVERAGCRVKILDAQGFQKAALETVGGSEDGSGAIERGWNELRLPGRGYLSSFYLSTQDIVSEKLDEVWSFVADAARPITHTTVVVALRRQRGQVVASAMLRFTSTQPLPAAPAPYMNRATGWQWKALQATIPGAQRLTGLPNVPVTADLDKAVVVGPSGIPIGGVGRDGLLLMPLSDPAAPTQITVYTDSDVSVRQLIRRAAAAGDRVAVYDSAGRWTMTAASSHIWSTPDYSAQPPWPPTLVVHNGHGNPYPGAWSSMVVAGPRSSIRSGGPNRDRSRRADIEIEIRPDHVRVRTGRFESMLTPVAFRSEQTYLN